MFTFILCGILNVSGGRLFAIVWPSENIWLIGSLPATGDLASGENAPINEANALPGFVDGLPAAFVDIAVAELEAELPIPDPNKDIKEEKSCADI